jgi:hypothetical protein
MNTRELRDKLTEIGKSVRYSIREAPKPGQLPNDVTVLEPEADGNGWRVFYTEKGNIYNPRHFDSEEEACAFILADATRPESPGEPLSPERLARAEQLRDEDERQYREALISKGRDPDTGEPINQGP